MKFERFTLKISTQKPLSLSFSDSKSGFFILYLFVCFCSALNETAPSTYLYVLSALDCASEGYLVGIFKLRAYGYAVSKSCYLYSKRL